MKKFFLFTLLPFFCIHTFGQNYNFTDTARTTKTKKLSTGLLFTSDLAYNEKGKLFNSYVSRKLGVGIYLSNANKDFLFYLGFGFKGFKISLFNPDFNTDFTNDVSQAYHPIIGNQKDSGVAVSVYTMAQKTDVSNYNMWGFYSQYLDVGFILTRFHLKPTLTYYRGFEDYVLWTPFAQSLTKHNDSYHDWISMSGRFNELKAGIDLVGLFNKENPFSGSLEINIGYKWMNYGGLYFFNVPIADYTNQDLADKYNLEQKITFGISFKKWMTWREFIN
jgi:hypothetical protein